VNQTPEQSSDTAIDATWLNWLPIIAGFLALILISNYISTFYKFPINQNSAGLGAFGDYMGGLLNPLISLFTLIVAMKVWNLQKIELIETRRAVEEQGKTAEQQRREQRFFDFLAIYQATLQSISFEEKLISKEINTNTYDIFNYGNYRKSPEQKTTTTFSTKTGKQAFSFLTSAKAPQTYRILYLFKPNNSNYSNSNEATTSTVIIDTWNETSPMLDHYFRTVFMLLREANQTLKEDNFRYIKLFRAQLSRDEVNLLAMNLLYDDEGKKMRALTANYGILKHMPPNHLREIAERELDPLSFGRKWAARQFVTLREESYAD
jgi:hypothetical protein